MSQNTLNVTLFPQLTDQWCWAASGQMVMDYEGTSVSQCAQANQKFGMSDCCNSPTPSACVKPGFPQFQHWGFNSQQTASGTALTLAQLTSQFDLAQPVAYTWRWTSGGGHMMVARGVDTGTNMVYINNPAPPNQGDTKWITYARYVSQSGVYTHGVDCYDITKASSPTGASSPPGSGPDPMTEDPASAPGGHDDPYGAAEEGLRLLPRLATDDLAPELRGGSPAELRLSPPFRVRYVFRDPLAEREPGDDPLGLLEEVNELLYPVLRGGEVAAAVRVVEDEGAWVLKSVGEPNLARDLERVRADDSAASNTPPSDYLMVDVPSLYQVFVGRVDRARGLVLLALRDDSTRGFIRGDVAAGAELLDRLVPDARRARDTDSEDGLLVP